MITNKSLGILNTLLGGFFFFIGGSILAEPVFHLYINYPFGWEVWRTILFSQEVGSGTILLALGGWMLFKGIKRLRK